MRTRHLPICLLFLHLAALAASAQEPLRKIEEDGGRFVLGSGGQFELAVSISNECDWDQDVVAVFRDGGKRFTVSGFIVTAISVPFTNDAEGQTSEHFTFQHEESTQGNKVCEFAIKSADVNVQWSHPDPSGLIPRSGSLPSGIELVLTQKVIEPSTPPPPAATPKPAVATTPGLTIDSVPSFKSDGTVDPPLEPIDNRPPLEVEYGPDGRAHPYVGESVYFRIRIINHCSWTQEVTDWPAPASIEPGGSVVRQSRMGNGMGQVAGRTDRQNTRFAHHATRVVDGVTVVCAAEAYPTVNLEWRDVPTDPATGQKFGSIDGPQVLQVSDVVLEESRGDAPGTTTTGTEPLPPPTTPTPKETADPRVPAEVEYGADGRAHPYVGSSVNFRIRIINHCSWTQEVSDWPEPASIPPGGSIERQSRMGNGMGQAAGRTDSQTTRFAHSATKVINGVTVTCAAEAYPQASIEWRAPPANLATGKTASVPDPQLLKISDVILEERRSGSPGTTTEVPTQPLDPTPAPASTTGVTLDCGTLADCFPLDNCTAGACGGVETWTPSLPDGWDNAFQYIGAETPRMRIEISTHEAAARPDLNPLGLLSKSFDQFIEWWMPTLEAAEQDVRKGLQFLITSQGGSTGKNLTMQVLNFTGKPTNLEGMVALEPLKKDAQQKMTQAFTKLAGRQLPTKFDLNGYCFEFLKLPPIAGQIMRVAPPDVQKRFEPMKKIMAAANRLTATGALKPDSNPAAYADSIKQWAIWTTQEKFNQSKFADAFVHHTQKNVEAAGQKWSKQIEDVVRQRVPGRWQDIVQILKTAGAAVPQ